MTPDYLNGRSEAQEINTRLNVAYYLEGVGDTTSAAHHYSIAVREFHSLAAAFGYTVEKIDHDTSHSDVFLPRPGLGALLEAGR